MDLASSLAVAGPRRWAARSVALALLASAAALPLESAPDDAKTVSYGRHLAQECASCHRLDGTDDGIPPIIGWPADKLAATLKLYQTAGRTNPVMVSVARSLNEGQIDALASYLASLPKPQPRSQ
jgi:cytochrome c553